MPPEGGVHGNPQDKCAKMCRMYVGSAIWRRSVEKKSGKNLQGKNYRGGCNNPPLSCIRVKTPSGEHLVAYAVCYPEICFKNYFLLILLCSVICLISYYMAIYHCDSAFSRMIGRYCLIKED